MLAVAASRQATASTLRQTFAGPEQRTLPCEMFAGIRENISPTITAAAVILTVFSVALLACLEALRRRGERLKANVP